MKLYLGNVLGVVASAGLLIPWAVIRVARYRAEWAACHHRLGVLLASKGSARTTEAEANYQAARNLQQAIVDTHPDRAAYRRSLADTQHWLAVLLRDAGRSAESEQLYRQALDHRRHLAEVFHLAVAAGHD